MKNNKMLTVLFVGVAAVLLLTGVAIACQAARLGSYTGGTEVEGTVYDYRVQGSSHKGGGYYCFLSCRYVDENGHNYVTEFQYNLSNASYDDAVYYGRAQLDKPVKLYLKGSTCVSEVEMKRYVPYVAVSPVLFVAGAAFAAMPLIIKAVKNRRTKPVAHSEEDYLG